MYRPIINDRGVATRYHRAVLVHRTALAAAGFDPRQARRAELTNLFSRDLCSALCSEENEPSKHSGRYRRAGQILAQGNASWSSLRTAFSALDEFIRDRKSGYAGFEERYRQTLHLW